MIDVNDEKSIERFIVDSIHLINLNSATLVRSQISKGGFTYPQINVLKELFKEDGLILKELSKRLSLSHSTVSGIIDRLETRNAVIRRQDTCDGRFTRIFISEQMSDYFKNILSQMYTPFINAVHKLQPDEKAKILEGLSIFCRLLKELE